MLAGALKRFADQVDPSDRDRLLAGQRRVATSLFAFPAVDVWSDHVPSRFQDFAAPDLDVLGSRAGTATDSAPAAKRAEATTQLSAPSSDSVFVPYSDSAAASSMIKQAMGRRSLDEASMSAAPLPELASDLQAHEANALNQLNIDLGNRKSEKYMVQKADAASHAYREFQRKEEREPLLLLLLHELDLSLQVWFRYPTFLRRP